MSAPTEEWIPFVIPPSTHEHPTYGTITITAEQNRRFVEHFNQHIYANVLPVYASLYMPDVAGWVRELRMADDGSVEALVCWSHTGTALIDAFPNQWSIAPSWMPAWTNPATGDVLEDVIVGASLTKYPFFPIHPKTTHQQETTHEPT